MYLGMTRANIVVVFCQAQMNIIWNVKSKYGSKYFSFPMFLSLTLQYIIESYKCKLVDKIWSFLGHYKLP